MKTFLLVMSDHVQTDQEAINYHSQFVGEGELDATFKYRKEYNLSTGQWGSVSAYEIKGYDRTTGAMELGECVRHYAIPLTTVVKYNNEAVPKKATIKIKYFK